MIRRRNWMGAAALAMVAGADPGVGAQPTPRGPQAGAGVRPVRLLVPFGAGGATDITARVIADPLARLLARPVLVENRPGAGGATCMVEVAAAAPDGDTLGVATLSTHGVNPAVYASLPYDALTGFTPITEIVKAPGVLVVHPDVGVAHWAGLQRLLRSRPGQLAYASPGVGTIGHMWGELLQSTTGTRMVHQPHRGAAQALAEVLAGRAPVYFDQVASALPHIQQGRLTALAVSWSERLAVLPDVPTYAELSLFANNDPSWFGLVGPAGVPGALARRLRDAVAQVLQEREVQQRLAEQGLYPSASLPGEFAVQIRKEVDKMRRVSRFARIRLA